MERILTRVALKSARPRDLILLRATLALLPEISQAIAGNKSLAGMQNTGPIKTATPIAAPPTNRLSRQPAHADSRWRGDCCRF